MLDTICCFVTATPFLAITINSDVGTDEDGAVEDGLDDEGTDEGTEVGFAVGCVDGLVEG
jgi:hypothetical protein